MDTAAECLQFAVRFAQMDLARLRPGDVLNLRGDLAAFLGYGVLPSGTIALSPRAGVVFYLGRSWTPEHLTEPEIHTLQDDTRGILQGVVEAQGAWATHATTGEETHVTPPLFRFTLHAQLLAQLPHTTVYRPCFQGPVREVFLCALFLLLGQEPADRILRCPECATIFYRVRKQRYCSRRCVNRATVRTWRQGERRRARQGRA